MTTLTTTLAPKSKQSVSDRIFHHGFAVFLIVYGVWVWLPWLAPVFMHLGWTGAGKTIYFIYSFFCHQLPERSLFFFGEKTMYSLNQVQAAWQNTLDPMVLRQFVGNAAMGWKIAWSDRMISFYTSVWLFAVAWWPLRRKVKPLPWWGFALLLLPLAIDGGTHTLSDFAGIGQGFRDSNLWLAALTNHALSPTFYAGDALGSFNSWMRLLTGLLAGLGIVWLVFPYMFQSQAQNQELKNLDYAKVIEQIRNGDVSSGRR
jgi:uncharacterized membrane protein